MELGELRMSVRKVWVLLARDRRGVTAIEYALLAAVVALGAMGGLVALGSGTGGLYDTLDGIRLAIQG
jgi:Flp pilus assembly pilin Flp